METERRSRMRKLFDGATVAVFALAVGFPLYGFLCCEPAPVDENRARYTAPALTLEKYTWQAYPKHFELYLGDHLGYRDVLLDWNRRVARGLFDESVTDKAWLGKDGWLYMNQSDPFRASRKVPGVEARAEAWVEAFAVRDAWFRARGIAYIVLIAPDKAAVYPEYLRGYPVRHPPPEMGTPVATKLNARGVTCVNLLPALCAEKVQRPDKLSFYKTDSHWTSDGGRTAYRAVAEAVRGRFPDFRTHPDEDYTFETTSAGDIRKLAGIPDDAPMETARKHVPRTKIDTGTRDDYFSPAQRYERLNANPSLFSICPTAPGPPVLFLHDSFGAALWPFIASDFRRASSIGTYGVPLEAIRLEKPRLVIQLIVARQLYGLSPKNPPELRVPRP